MKITIKQHGFEWFFRGADDGDDFNSGFPECPECDNDGLNDDNKLYSIDMGIPEKVEYKYTLEYKCLKCGYHAIYERTEEEILQANEEEE